jgi:hypothetical protein
VAKFPLWYWENHPSACAVDLLLVRFIIVGRAFYRLPIDQQVAIYLHESAHLIFRHALYRLRWLFQGLPWRCNDELQRRCHEQEYSADFYVAAYGQTQSLISYLLTIPSKETIVHPSSIDRINRLRRYLCESR